MQHSRFIYLTLLFVFLSFSSCLFRDTYVFAQTDQTKLQLQTANTALRQAFNSVLSAEKAGADVSQLLEKLNTAGELLSNAQNTYNSVNTVNVTSKIENVLKITDQVNFEAVNLQRESIIKSQNNILFTLIFSIVGAIVFSIILFLSWRRFKRAHMMKLLGMRPEVVENTT